MPAGWPGAAVQRAQGAAAGHGGGAGRADTQVKWCRFDQVVLCLTRGLTGSFTVYTAQVESSAGAVCVCKRKRDEGITGLTAVGGLVQLFIPDCSLQR
jgi:hypothetical protein